MSEIDLSQARPRSLQTHELKLHERWFSDVRSGKKNFELRFDDRGYGIGDTLCFHEVNDEGKETGRSILRSIWDLYYEMPGLDEDYVLLVLDGPDFHSDEWKAGRK